MSRLLPLPLLVIAAAGCDLDQSFIYPDPIEGVPGVVDLGLITPIAIDNTTTEEEVRQSIVYGEMGPTGTVLTGGVTFEFEGVDGSVCIFVDPELVYWNQSVSSVPDVGYNQPDNLFDDGDIDLAVGLSPFYNGTPGELIGDFVVEYQDSLGNFVPVQLESCLGDPTDGSDPNNHRISLNGVPGAHAGRGAPEYCTVENTVVGERYTVVLDAWSLPLDDDRFGYGFIVSAGPCNDTLSGQFGLFSVFGSDITSSQNQENGLECLILGEAIIPGEPSGSRAADAGLEGQVWLGENEVPSWPRSKELEQAFCQNEPATFCTDERRRVENNDLVCSWQEDATDPAEEFERCFCGDPRNTPEGGAL